MGEGAAWPVPQEGPGRDQDHQGKSPDIQGEVSFRKDLGHPAGRTPSGPGRQVWVPSVGPPCRALHVGRAWGTRHTPIPPEVLLRDISHGPCSCPQCAGYNIILSLQPVLQQQGQPHAVDCVLRGSLLHTQLWSRGAGVGPEGSNFENTPGGPGSGGPSDSVLATVPLGPLFLASHPGPEPACPSHSRAPPRRPPSHHAWKGPATQPLPFSWPPNDGPVDAGQGALGQQSHLRQTLDPQSPTPHQYSRAGCRAPLPAPHRRQGS